MSTATNPYENFELAERDAEAGISDAMIYLANQYEFGVRGGPRANGHKALCYYMAAFRRESQAWAHIMARVITDMEGYFNPITPQGGVRMSPIPEEMVDIIRENALRTISLFPELKEFPAMPKLLRTYAVERALDTSGGLRISDTEFGDWREAIDHARSEDAPAQLSIAA